LKETAKALRGGAVFKATKSRSIGDAIVMSRQWVKKKGIGQLAKKKKLYLNKKRRTKKTSSSRS